MANDDEITKDVASLTDMAKRLGLKGRQLTQYVTEHMEKLGYEAKTNVTYHRKAGSGNSRQSGGFLSGLLSGGSGDGEDDE